jgi:hypothetical protein
MANAQVHVTDILSYGRFMLNDPLVFPYMPKIWSDEETLQYITSGCMISVSKKYITRPGDIAKPMPREIFLTKNIL